MTKTDTRTDLLHRLAEILGEGGLDTSRAARRVYARDASHLELGEPLAVALPTDAAQVQTVLAACAAAAVPVVCRGAGTGLSGGAVPADGAVVLGTSRLGRLDAVDAGQRTVRVEAGVLNTAVSRAAAPWRLHFAPDPSSQAAATVGGNIAENAGGPHCLRLGVTLRHLRRLEWADAEGRSWSTGRGLSLERGIDLCSLLCGSEGTLGVVTAATLALTADPSTVLTMLAFFPRLADATAAVVRLLGSGVLPVAVEIVDQSMLKAVEAAFAFGFPTDVEAAMIVEFGGEGPETEHDGATALPLLESSGACEVRVAADDAERLRLWQCRKRAFGAVGRLSPSYVTMDVVVPLGQLTGLVHEIRDIRRRFGVSIATVFHAGDGNLHPGVHYDDRDPDQKRQAHLAADEIIAAALRRDGSVTGEHGVGIEKRHVLPWQIDAECARLMGGIKELFDPRQQLNPGKILPSSGDTRWADMRPEPEETAFAWESLTVTAPASARLATLQDTALERGFWIPIGMTSSGCGLGGDAEVGDLVTHLAMGPGLLSSGSVRDYLLEIWAETGDGRRFHAGAPVFKNVAGYDLVHMICGSGSMLVKPLAATFQLRPAPPAAAMWRFDTRGDAGLDENLGVLCRELADAVGGLADPSMVLDDGDGAPQVFVLAAGREEPWGLPALQARLEEIAASAGWRLTDTARRPFAGAGGFLETEGIPDWVRDASDWTMLATAGGDQAPWLPSETRRLVWQAAPRLVWVPAAMPGAAPWQADAVRRGGIPTPPPPPPAGVPRRLLRGLVELFDPGGALPRPRWLETDADD